MPQAPAWPLPLRNPQPFTAPDPFHAVPAGLPLSPQQQRRDAAISTAAILVGEFNEARVGAHHPSALSRKLPQMGQSKLPQVGRDGLPNPLFMRVARAPCRLLRRL